MTDISNPLGYPENFISFGESSNLLLKILSRSYFKNFSGALLDVGAGKGDAYDVFSKKFGNSFEYTAVEPSELFFSLKNKVLNFEKKNVVHEDILHFFDNLSFVNKKWDLILFKSALHEILLFELRKYFSVETNEELHKIYLNNSLDFLKYKKIILNALLKKSAERLNPSGKIIIIDVGFDPSTPLRISDEHTLYVSKKYSHYNSREQLVFWKDVEDMIPDILKIDCKEIFHNRDDSGFKTCLWGLVLSKE